MSQFKKPFKLPYDDDFGSLDAFHNIDTAKVKAIWPVNKPKERKKITIVNFAIIMFISMIGLMCIYTFFIILIALLKIFILIVIGG
jgi:hypothetical protein